MARLICGEKGSVLFYDSGETTVKKNGEGKRQTNAEQIRSMSDEELAEFLRNVKEDYQWANPDYPGEDDFGAWVKWLQSEAEE